MRNKLLYVLFMAALLSSCNDGRNSDVYGNLSIVIKGSVTDMDGRAIEHIKISASSDQTGSISCYSSSDGRFQCNLLMEKKETITIAISIEDIDDQETGGLYDKKDDTITIFEEDFKKFPMMIDLNTYRLSLSTPSESTPQS